MESLTPRFLDRMVRYEHQNLKKAQDLKTDAIFFYPPVEYDNFLTALSKQIITVISFMCNEVIDETLTKSLKISADITIK